MFTPKIVSESILSHFLSNGILENLTSLYKESRPFLLGDNTIWSFPSVLPLAITAFGGPEGYFIF